MPSPCLVLLCFIVLLGFIQAAFRMANSSTQAVMVFLWKISSRDGTNKAPASCNICVNILFDLSCCLHAGTTPTSWSSINAFSSLAALTLYDLPLTGSLPAEWGSNGSLPAMQNLKIGTGRPDFSCLSGTLPADWASAATFQNLTKLEIGACMTGASLCNLCAALQTQTRAVPCTY